MKFVANEKIRNGDRLSYIRVGWRGSSLCHCHTQIILTLILRYDEGGREVLTPKILLRLLQFTVSIINMKNRLRAWSINTSFENLKVFAFLIYESDWREIHRMRQKVYFVHHKSESLISHIWKIKRKINENEGKQMGLTLLGWKKRMGLSLLHSKFNEWNFSKLWRLF